MANSDRPSAYQDHLLFPSHFAGTVSSANEMQEKNLLKADFPGLKKKINHSKGYPPFSLISELGKILEEAAEQ